jgi:hypothetical protein
MPRDTARESWRITVGPYQRIRRTSEGRPADQKANQFLAAAEATSRVIGAVLVRDCWWNWLLRLLYETVRLLGLETIRLLVLEP